MPLSARLFASLEILEARIAPAILITNPLPDLGVGPGKTGATIDLSKLTTAADSAAYHTKVKFITNVDMDAATAGLQAGEIVIELYDDKAPRTVEDFLRYVNNLNAAGDYDGTIIHRSADFGATSGTGNDIIQGGGYNFPGFAHIPVGPEVFNEYSSARENVRGTIALAKTGLGPSTGTSEWFFNVNDNTSILNGSNNSGYAVFGKIVSGLDVMDKIAGLTTKNLSNLGSALSELPVQNGFTTGTPNADQVVRIVDAAVLPATPSNTGLTYSISHIYNVGANGVATTATSTLVTGKVTGAQLDLKYAAGGRGLADVVVKVSNGTESVEDTFRVDLRPNLFLIDPSTQVIVPGDTAPLKFKVINDGFASLSGSAKIQLSMQRLNSSGAPVGSPIDLGTQTASISVAAGAAQVLTLPTKIPQTLATSSDENYRITAKVVPALTGERSADDNTSSGGTHQLVNQFGNVNGRTNVALKYTSGGSVITWTLNGPGVATLVPDGSGHVSLEASGTTLGSTIAAASTLPAVHAALTGIQIDNVVATANLGLVDVSGPVVISSGVRILNLGKLQAGSQSLVLIGALLPGNTIRSTITLGAVADFSLESDMPIGSLTAASWNDSLDDHDSILAPTIGVLKVNGNLEADVTLTDDQPMTSITVTGLLHNATIATPGNIGTITLGGISFGNVFAGTEARPGSLDDFAQVRTIQSFTITGIKNYTFGLFVNSQVAAQTIGTIKVQGINTGGTGDFGFVADVIRSYTRVGGVTKANLTAAGEVDRQNDYLVQIL
jgi:cyclophilin family peptidyl-prolyl cis-trans isomerase